MPDLIHYILFALSGLIAEILGTVGGFGSSVIFVPLANFFMDYQSVLGITAVFHVVSNVSKIWLFREHFNWKIILWVGLPGVVFVALGAWLSGIYDTRYLNVALGIFLCLFATFYYFKPEFEVNGTIRNQLFLGSSAGFLAGLLGTGGAIRGMALSSMHIAKNTFVGTSAAIDFGVDATRSVIYWKNGFLHSYDLPYLVILALVAVAGSWLGKKVLDRISEARFSAIILLMIFMSGVALIVKSALVD
ncbi:MAG: sulfite exporter TauE/SafE family protein [Bacteroidetes bacterium]|nr:sulfite exporter TauE/SafE family protein [Bacteroidota bacterium]